MPWHFVFHIQIRFCLSRRHERFVCLEFLLFAGPVTAFAFGLICWKSGQLACEALFILLKHVPD